MANKVTLNNGNVLATADISAQGTVTGSTHVNAPASLTYKNKELSTYFSELDGKYLKLSSDTMQQVVGDMDVTGEMEADTVRVDTEIFYRENLIEDVFVSKNADDGIQTMENSLVIAGGNDLEVTGGITVAGDVQTSDSLMRESQVYLQSAIPTVLSSGHVYDLGVINSAQDLSGISFPVAASYVQTCEIWLTTGATSYLITWPANSKWPSEVDGVAPTVAPLSNSRHRYVIRKEADGTLVINKAYSYFV